MDQAKQTNSIYIHKIYMEEQNNSFHVENIIYFQILITGNH